MAEFLTTNGTSYHIENVIINAKKKLILVSPYLQISKTFYERLKDSSNRGVHIKIIFGKDELKPNEKNSLAELNNLELLYFENLHAKCYFNEVEMVITSMNMYEFSEKNNREMGVFISKEKDSVLFENAVNETLSIVQSSEIIKLAKTKRKLFRGETTVDKKTKKRAYCIRCEERIKYNTDSPYCLDCYRIWAQFGNSDYEENVCHSCGEFENTSMEKPECYTCYSQKSSSKSKKVYK